MKKATISAKCYSIFRKLLLFKVYYYDEMILKVPKVNTETFFDKSEAEHIVNHMHLEEYIDYPELSRNDLSDITKLLFFRLKALYPEKKVIVYLVFDDEGKPILDFGLCRQGEMLYYDIASDNIEYYV